LILLQRPYGIGDRINISNPESDANGGGSQGWIVDDVTLFATTIYLAGTNEKATVSNGTLAKSRIINCARSHKAILVLNLKFGLDSQFNRIEIFKSAVEKFVKARPREWLALLAIRANRVEADLGFVEYGVVLQHRESW
jgi:small-conductance mechanosensitive channel